MSDEDKLKKLVVDSLVNRLIEEVNEWAEQFDKTEGFKEQTVPLIIEASGTFVGQVIAQMPKRYMTVEAAKDIVITHMERHINKEKKDEQGKEDRRAH